MLSDQLDLLYEEVESNNLPEFLGGEMPDQLLLRDYFSRMNNNDDSREQYERSPQKKKD